jgi:hypothetical protein
MSFFHANSSSPKGRTSIVYRAIEGIPDAREVFNDACQLKVRAFPMPMVRETATAKAVPACYILTNDQTAYPRRHHS